MKEWMQDYGPVIGAITGGFIAGFIGIVIHEYKSYKEKRLHRKSLEIELKYNLGRCRELYTMTGLPSQFHTDRLKAMYVHGNLAQVVGKEELFSDIVSVIKRMEECNALGINDTKTGPLINWTQRDLEDISEKLGLLKTNRKRRAFSNIRHWIWCWMSKMRKRSNVQDRLF